MGGWDGVDTARRSLNGRGLELVLDFVPNHTAFDHPWTSEHPDRYVPVRPTTRARAGGFSARWRMPLVACGRDPNFPPWRDVAQLNYFNPETRVAMAGELRTIAAHCDGVRCDMAMLVLNDVFERTWRHVLRDRWTVTRRRVLAGRRSAVCRNCCFSLKWYWDLEWTLQQQGFHYTYDKRLLDWLRGSTPDDVRGHLRASLDYSARMVRFLENHDEPRSAASLATGFRRRPPSLRRYRACGSTSTVRSTVVRSGTPVQLARWVHEPVDPRWSATYERLLATAASPLLRQGAWTLLDVSSAGDSSFGDLIAFRWRRRDAVAVVVANLGSHTASGCAVRRGSPTRGDVRLYGFDWRTSPTAGRADRSTCEARTCDSSRGPRTCSSSQ